VLPYLFAAGLAAIIAAAASVTRTRTGVVVVLLLCGYNVLPLTARGQQMSGSVMGALVTVHVLAIAVWVGSLAALLAHARRSPELLAVAVPRFGRLALVCFVVVAAFGMAAAWIDLGSLDAVRSSRYGTVVVYKAEALVALGAFAWWHRRRIIPEVKQERSWYPFARFAAIEVAVMAAAIGLGVALSGTHAPAAPLPAPKHDPYIGVLAPSPAAHPAANRSSAVNLVRTERPRPARLLKAS
jgi:putative copper export protein